MNFQAGWGRRLGNVGRKITSNHARVASVSIGMRACIRDGDEDYDGSLPDGDVKTTMGFYPMEGVCGIHSAHPPSVHALAASIIPGAHLTLEGMPACLDPHTATLSPVLTLHTCTRESAPPLNTYFPSGVQHASKLFPGGK